MPPWPTSRTIRKPAIVGNDRGPAAGPCLAPTRIGLPSSGSVEAVALPGRTGLAGRSPVLEGSQEAGPGAVAARIRRGRLRARRLVPGDDELLQRLLTGRASFHMVLDGLPLPVVEPLIQQALQLVEGHAGPHPRSPLGGLPPAHSGGEVRVPGRASSRPRTSLRRCFITWLRDTKTAATFMPSRAAASAPERPSTAVRR